MDYGKPAAQFLSQDVAGLGRPCLGRKVTAKGTVTRIDMRDPKAAWVFLGHGVRCNFGAMTAMAGSVTVGRPVVVDGFLRRCERGDVLIEPAMLRDPHAPFSPERPPAESRGDGSR